MCGRFTQMMSWSQVHDLYHYQEPAAPLSLTARYNGAPTQDFAACRLDEAGRRTVVKLRWGLVPAWAKDVRMGFRLINARAETVHSKPSFGAAFRSRRCLVPANGWFEWRRDGRNKQPYFLALADGSLLSFAGLWERWSSPAETRETFTVITTAAASGLADIHHRQPAIVDPGRFDDWLDPSSSVTKLLDLVREPYAGPYEKRAVSTKVNSVRNNHPDILAPAPERSLF